MNLGRIFGSRGFETGTNVLTSLFGMRSQNKGEQVRHRRERAGYRPNRSRWSKGASKRSKTPTRMDRADAERRWQAEQERAKQAYEQTQEQLAYQRSLSDRQLRLDDEREARRAVYRPYSEAAMRSLGSILRLR
jgi:hypothetical protein